MQFFASGRVKYDAMGLVEEKMISGQYVETKIVDAGVPEQVRFGNIVLTEAEKTRASDLVRAPDKGEFVRELLQGVNESFKCTDTAKITVQQEHVRVSTEAPSAGPRSVSRNATHAAAGGPISTHSLVDVGEGIAVP
jgi:hypothetical protein